MISVAISVGREDADPLAVQIDTDADYTTAIAADMCRLAHGQLHDALVVLNAEPVEPTA